ncbi:complement C1r subcomponent [Tachyglossus aculeatus]|uniref:complement C1r subcomponent n=1 Tax=Tachyglossus aculeatus TaxID=9261 RepID=UPI0018F2CAE9|nr:complement C1r subcomponent [Tachyglossus aculeatus]
MLQWVILGALLLGGPGRAGAVAERMFGEVTSPRYPRPYPNLYHGTTDIAVPAGYRVKLGFWQFDLEPSEACFYDYVKVSADKTDLGRFCGRADSAPGQHPGRREFLSKGNRMRLTMHTDFSNEENGTTVFYKGFLAYYQAVDRNECTEPDDAGPRCKQLCHNTVGSYFCSCRPGYRLNSDRHSCRADCSAELYTEPAGSVSSLDYPQPYPPDTRCNYSIRVDRGLSLTLKFLEPFEIDDHQQVRCPYDQLQIYAGGRLLEEYCGTKNPGVLDTGSNAVDLVFLTDESGFSRGWKLRYSSKAVQCPRPVPRDQFTVIRDPQPLYEYRDYFIAACKTGYQLNEGNRVLPSFTAVCQDDGTWHRAMPSCKIVNCGPASPLPNGMVKYLTGPGLKTYEAQIQYECQEPYYRLLAPGGTGTYTCSAQGAWKDQLGGKKIPLCLPVCGQPDTPVVHKQRIIGGDKAQRGNFPWQAFIRVQGRSGGALLGDRWVLTAAHVFRPKGGSGPQDLEQVHVFLGHTDLEEIEKLGAHPVRRVVIHPDYRPDDPDDFNADIALLELEDSVRLGPDLLPICLPDPGNASYYESGRLGYVSGFGEERKRLSDQLKYVRLPVAARAACQAWLRIHRRADVFSQNMFCAGDRAQKQDACQGDSGGVFAVQDDHSDRWVASGIVSWGIGCGNGYGFYTKVLEYVAWIREVMGGQEAGA